MQPAHADDVGLCQTGTEGKQDDRQQNDTGYDRPAQRLQDNGHQVLSLTKLIGNGVMAAFSYDEQPARGDGSANRDNQPSHRKMVRD
jgi:hypothetical protein